MDEGDDDEGGDGHERHRGDAQDDAKGRDEPVPQNSPDSDAPAARSSDDRFRQGSTTVPPVTTTTTVAVPNGK